MPHCGLKTLGILDSEMKHSKQRVNCVQTTGVVSGKKTSPIAFLYENRLNSVNRDFFK